MTSRPRRLLQLTLLALGLSLVGVVVITYLTWPANLFGDYVRIRQNREANIRTLTKGIEREADPFERRFYQAMLAEEKGELEKAIRGLQSLRDDAEPGSKFHLKVTLRLGQVYGLNRQPEEELATYQALMNQYPGPSRLSQAAFYLRQGDRSRARALLDEALVQDEKDGSLGSDRRFAQQLQSMAGSKEREGVSPSR